MKKILTIIQYTFIENIRNKMMYLILIFTFFVIFSAFLFSKIAGEQETRIIFDSGMTTIEIFTFIIAIFISVRLILSEIEGKTLYLVFSKPVKRYTYLLGRYFGVLMVLLFNIVLMALPIYILLILKNWIPEKIFLLSLLMIFIKISIISAVSLFFSLLSTSYTTALVVSFFTWILGHAVYELKYLSKEISNIFIKILLLIMTNILPDLQIFNFKEYPAEKTITGKLVLYNINYAIFYVVMVLFLSIIIFKKKEL